MIEQYKRTKSTWCGGWDILSSHLFPLHSLLDSLSSRLFVKHPVRGSRSLLFQLCGSILQVVLACIHKCLVNFLNIICKTADSITTRLAAVHSVYVTINRTLTYQSKTYQSFVKFLHLGQCLSIFEFWIRHFNPLISISPSLLYFSVQVEVEVDSS